MAEINFSLLSDYSGILGVILVLVSYFLLQTEKLDPKHLSYSLINLIGALLILFSLAFHWNFASVIIEIVWSLISIYGIWRAIYTKKTT